MVNNASGNAVDKSTARLQNICGSVFIIMFASQFVFHLLRTAGLMPLSASWFAYVVGGLSVLGFILLYKLATNMTSDIFALSIICFECFFAIGRPIIMSVAQSDMEQYSMVLLVCAILSFLALYMWAMLFNNNRPVNGVHWLLFFLPLPFILNIIGYSGYLFKSHGVNTLSSLMMADSTVMAVMRMCLDPLLALGYWKLSHSPSFAGRDEYSIGAATRLTPFNRYMLAYAVLAVLALAPLPPY